MQINSSWEPTLRRMGISWDRIADPCTNVMVGAWVLSHCIHDYGYTWTAVGCYNSRTPSKRDRYASRIARIVGRESVLPAPIPSVMQLAAVSQTVTPWDEVFGNAPR